MNIKAYTERLMRTKANSSERGHEVENIIDNELTLRGIAFEDMLPDDLRNIARQLKQVKSFDTIVYELIELKEILNAIEDNHDIEEGGFINNV